MYKPSVGDIITTNLICDAGGSQFTTGVSVDVSTFTTGAYLSPNINGVLQSGANPATTTILLYRIVAISTTPDLQGAVKLQCVQIP